MEDYDYGYEQDNPGSQKKVRGYQIIIVVLAVILAALSFIYFRQMDSLKEDFALEREGLNNQFTALMGDYDNLRTTNDTIKYQLGMERQKADSLMTSLAKERSLSLAKIRKYEKELGTLRTVMREYVHQIDSLNNLNKSLIRENVGYRQQVATERMRADKAEETAGELSTKVRQGSVVQARNISLRPLSKNDREVSRANRAERLRVDFTLAANALAEPGERAVYVRITGPDGYLLANSGGGVFQSDGESKSFSAAREVDYQNQDLGVSLYYSGSGIVSGKYQLEIYFDGHRIGSTEILLK